MRLVFAVLLTIVVGPTFGADEDRVISPNRRLALVTTTASHDEQQYMSYAIRARATGKTLAVCPKDDRYASNPFKVLWSPNSRFVAVATATGRHGNLVDLWWVSSTAAKRIKVDFSKEEDRDIHVALKEWLNATELRCDVFGRSGSAHRQVHPTQPWVGYLLRIRIDPDSHKARVFRTKPEYSGQS